MTGDPHVREPDLSAALPAPSTVTRSLVAASSSMLTAGTEPSGSTSATADRSSVEIRTDVTGAPVKVSNDSETSPTRVGRSNLASIHCPSGRANGAVPHAV